MRHELPSRIINSDFRKGNTFALCIYFPLQRTGPMHPILPFYRTCGLKLLTLLLPTTSCFWNLIAHLSGSYTGHSFHFYTFLVVNSAGPSTNLKKKRNYIVSV
jgi:hypothetical protein